MLTDEPQIVGELVASAINDANQKLEALKQESMGSLTQGLNLPPALNFFFMSVSPLLVSLEQALRCLPGVGRDRRRVWPCIYRGSPERSASCRGSERGT